MDFQATPALAQKQSPADAGRYFQNMIHFVGFTAADADAIRQTAPIFEKNLPEIVASFYAHLLGYPPTSQFFLKDDGSVDQAYLELRMRHLTNFWRRTATGVYDDEYARYLDYVGRAHTAQEADPGVSIAENYVIGQVGFVQHAVSEALMREAPHQEPGLLNAAVEAWDKLLIVILEMLTRPYRPTPEVSPPYTQTTVDQAAINQLTRQVF